MSMSDEYAWADAGVTRNDPPVTGNAFDVMHTRLAEIEAAVEQRVRESRETEIERRVRVRKAEAEDAARVAREALRMALDPGRPERVLEVGSASIERMAHTARLHDMLAEALNEVLEGGF